MLDPHEVMFIELDCILVIKMVESLGDVLKGKVFGHYLAFLVDNLFTRSNC